MSNTLTMEDLAVETQPGVRRWPREFAMGATALAGAVGVGAAVAALTGSRRGGLIAGGATLALAGAVRWQLQRWFTEQPAYEVERTIGDLEIRRYPARLQARTFVEAPFETAIDEGFRRLARYIFGGNATHERVAMSTPVSARYAEEGQEVTFTMPPGKHLEDLPRPDDPHIDLVESPARRVAVLKFRGRYKAKTVEAEMRRLRELVDTAGLVPRGEPMFAGYDPPMTLPFLRRVEVWLEV